MPEIPILDHYSHPLVLLLSPPPPILFSGSLTPFREDFPLPLSLQWHLQVAGDLEFVVWGENKALSKVYGLFFCSVRHGVYVDSFSLMFNDVTIGVEVVLNSCPYHYCNLQLFILFISPWLHASLKKKKSFSILIPVWTREKLETLNIAYIKRFILI